LKVYLEIEIRRSKCKINGIVRQEQLEWLSETSGYTKRFAYYVGRRCEKSTIKDVAKELMLDWKTVKNLEKEYLKAKLKKASPVNPEIIGIDEVSIRKGHEYRIVVSDLLQKRPIWFGGIDRSKDSLDMFYQALNSLQRNKIRLAVMDMWKAFEKSTKENIPDAAILYDKFHVIRHLNEALDKVRRLEYKRVSEKTRKYIKGQKYTLLSRKDNLSLKGKRSLQKLFKINKRLNVAYILKESFGQLWSYRSEKWAYKFFNNWKDSLKWQRLKPYEEFSKMIERHWDGIAAFCKSENKVSLGFVEGVNNKIKLIQRRAFGLRDEEYLKLKILTCTLPELE